MRRRLSLLLMLCLLVSMCACSGKIEIEGGSQEEQQGSGVHEHAFGLWHTVTESTCVATGSRRRTCDCGHVETQDIPALGHFLTAVAGKNATYDEEGFLAHWVCDCGMLFFDAAGLKLAEDQSLLKLDRLVHVQVTTEAVQDAIWENHQQESVTLVPEQAPANATVGSVEIPVNAIKSVADAGKNLIVETQQAIVLLDKVAQEAITAQAGKSKSVTIEVMQISPDAMNQAQRDSVQTKTIALVLSAQVTSDKKEISYFDGGTATVKIPFVIPADKETADFSVVYIADDGTMEEIPSIYEAGNLVVKLEHFSHYAVVEKNKHAHKYKTKVTGPSCTETGFTTFICDDCGHFYRSDMVAPNGHRFDEWKIDKEATCIAEGDEKRTCPCGEVEIRKMPLKKHKFGDWVEVEKIIQCQQDGYKERTCACGEKERINVSCHKFGKWVVRKKPIKCLEDGYEERTCSCGMTEERAISCHKLVVHTVVAPTCFRGGYTKFRCTTCGETCDDVYTKALGHIGEWVIVREPVHGVKVGLRKRYCSRCDGTISETIPFHSESDWIVDKAPTKETDGSKHTECTVCGTVLKTGVLYGGSVGLKWSALGLAVGGDGVPMGMGEAVIHGMGACKDTDVVIPRYIDDGFAVFKVVKISYAYVHATDGEPIGGFERCFKLRSVVVPEGVTEISYNAFKNCGLKSITLPNTLTSIRWGAFWGTNLTEIHFNGTMAQWETIEKVDITDGQRYTVYCTDGNLVGS